MAADTTKDTFSDVVSIFHTARQAANWGDQSSKRFLLRFIGDVCNANPEQLAAFTAFLETCKAGSPLALSGPAYHGAIANNGLDDDEDEDDSDLDEDDDFDDEDYDDEDDSDLDEEEDDSDLDEDDDFDDEDDEDDSYEEEFFDDDDETDEDEDELDEDEE